MSAPQFYPALNKLVSTDNLPELIKSTVDTVSNKLFYKTYYVEKSIYGEAAYHHIVLIFNTDIGLNLIGGGAGGKGGDGGDGLFGKDGEKGEDGKNGENNSDKKEGEKGGNVGKGGKGGDVFIGKDGKKG